MSTGKAVAQGAHASEQAVLLNYLHGSKETHDKWFLEGSTKVVLAVKSIDALVKCINTARLGGLPYSLITDEGRTEFTEPTCTCGAIGPGDAEEIDKITKRLRLY